MSDAKRRRARSREMRVLVASNTFYPRLVGPAVSIGHLVTRFNTGSDRLHVIAPRYQRQDASGLDAHVTRTSSMRFRGLENWALPLPVAAARAVRRVLDEFRPHVVHIHQPFVLGMTALRAARARGIPVLYTFHTFYEHYVHYVPPQAARWIANWLVARQLHVCRSVDHIVVPNSSISARLASKGVTTPATVIPTGIEQGRFSSPVESNELRERLGIGPQLKMLLYVGRITREKRVDFLIDVVKHLPREEFVLVVVGDGGQAGALRNRADRLGLRHSIRWLGAMPQHELPAYYANADLFLFSSVSDTQAIVLYEALAARLPIVAVDSIAARAAITSVANGMIVDDNAETFAAAVMRRAMEKRKDARLARSHDLEVTLAAHGHLYRTLAATESHAIGSLAIGGGTAQ